MTTDTFTNVEGRRVVAPDTAETIGAVKGFVLDAGVRKIKAIHVHGRKRTIVLDWSAVAAFGADAVMTIAGAGTSAVDKDQPASTDNGDVTILGARVLTLDGREVGTVADVEFDIDSGGVVRVVTDQGPINVDRLRALGSYALIVEEDISSTGR